MELLAPVNLRALQRRLRRWFQRASRDLPWRHDRDPYRIWVSEIMLQQTQVATVIPYFERFIQAYPTVAHLAASDEAQVLKLWEGLGYYRRARGLHQAARRIMADHAGDIPSDPVKLRRLPGIGRYTMGAILSQAFGFRLPILEANSVRVLCRLLAEKGDPKTSAVRNQLWQVAEAILPRKDVGTFNQALMELGALVCTPSDPNCKRCPVANFCSAHRQGLVEEIPQAARTRRTLKILEVATVVRRGGRVLLAQRPQTGRWAGLWEFPHGPLPNGESQEEGAARILEELTGIKAQLGPKLVTIKHAVTHHQITLVCFLAIRLGGSFRSRFFAASRWIRPQDLGEFPVSAPQRRLAEVLLRYNEKRQSGNQLVRQ